MMDKAVGADSALDYTLNAGDVFEGCVIADFFRKAQPTKLVYRESDSDNKTTIGPYTLWSGNLAAGHASTIMPTTLKTYNGSSSQVIHVADSVRKVVGLKMCWTFTGSGNHILEGESDTSGSDLHIYTNTVGDADSGCKDVMGTLEPVLQVLAEGDWTVALTGYPN